MRPGQPVTLAQIGECVTERARHAPRHQLEFTLASQQQREILGELRRQEAPVTEVDRMQGQHQHARADALESHVVFPQGEAHLCGESLAGVVVAQLGAQPAHRLARRGIRQRDEILSAPEYVFGHSNLV